MFLGVPKRPVHITKVPEVIIVEVLVDTQDAGSTARILEGEGIRCHGRVLLVAIMG
jgi:hypothetical protein